ncbi:MAG: hypothetical protein IKM46_01190 [Clostridia bacterium]|nr:hypothetical protein [Clostridia bacterium]
MLAVLIVAVNALTLIIVLQKRSSESLQSDETEVSEETEIASDISFGSPAEIILYGNGKEVSFSDGDSEFIRIYELNKNRNQNLSEYIPPKDSYDPSAISAYKIKYVYDHDFVFSPKNYSTFMVREIYFVLTGAHHGTLAFDVNGAPLILGGLPVSPELNEFVKELLT